MKEESQILSKIGFSESYTQVGDNYLMELNFDSNKGINIKVVNEDFIQCGNQLYLEISDDIINQSLRHTFPDVERLYAFMKDAKNIEMDIQARTIKLKIFKVVGDFVLDQSIKLKMIKKQLKIDKIIMQAFKRQNKKMQQKLSSFKKQLQDIKNDYKSKIEKVGQEVGRNQKKTRKSQKILLLFLFLLVSMILFNCCTSKQKQSYTQDSTQQKVDLNGISVLDAKISQKTEQFKETIKKTKTEFNQILKPLQKKVQDAVSKGELEKQIGKLNQNLVGTLSQITKSLENSLKNIKKSTQDFVNEHMKNLAVQINQKFTQIASNNTLAHLQQNIESDQKQNMKQTKKIQTLQTRLQNLEKIMKRTSIFDLTSPFFDSFNIEGNTLTNLALSGRWTQLLLRDSIPYEKRVTYKFKIARSANNAVIIGVVDSFRIKHRSSLQHNNTLAYTARGQLWKGGVLQPEKYKGFSQGCLVTMEVELSKGTIQWLVEGQVVLAVSSERLGDNTIAFRPYVEMAEMKDIIEVQQVI